MTFVLKLHTALTLYFLSAIFEYTVFIVNIYEIQLANIIISGF